MLCCKLVVDLLRREAFVSCLGSHVVPHTSTGVRSSSGGTSGRTGRMLSGGLVSENTMLKSRVDGMAKSQLDMVSEVGQLKSELQSVLGSLETLTRSVKVDQGTVVSGIEQQLQSLSERLARFEPQSFVIDNQTVLVDAKEKSAFEAAQGLLSSGATEAAAAAFDEFSRRFPDSALRPWALNFEGAAHYLRKNYKPSISALSELYKRYLATLAFRKAFSLWLQARPSQARREPPAVL